MYTHIHKHTITTGFAMTLLAVGAAAAADTVTQEVVEARQEAQIWTTYALSPYLRANDIKVSVHDGKATLTGKVEESVNKDLAKQIALGVNGVKEVDNQIVITADYVAPARQGDRSYGEVIDDATITAAVKSKLLWSRDTNGLDTDVDTKSGKVTLLGTADNAAAKALATRLAMNTRGVVSVNNELLVKAPQRTSTESASGTANTVVHVISDSWITNKVKSTFLYSSNVDGSDIAVSTKDGIVTLSGKVDSGAERALAIAFANNVRGVKGVHSKGLTLQM
jgi:osmotically-inducible protein OsmY